jgi:hypothetical protein
MNGLPGSQKSMYVQNAIAPTGIGTGFREISLSQGKVAIVDADDYNLLSQWKWCLAGREKYKYAVRVENKKVIFMHRIIMKTPVGFVVDHLDHNGLNNQKVNLRNCTQSQNTQNMIRSKYQGVSWNIKEQKFTSKIGVKRKRFHLGYFDNPKDAAMAYNNAAIKYFGEGAKVNLI